MELSKEQVLRIAGESYIAKVRHGKAFDDDDFDITDYVISFANSIARLAAQREFDRHADAALAGQAQAEKVRELEGALRQFAECDLHEGNCASLAVASRRIRSIAAAALADFATPPAAGDALDAARYRTIRDLPDDPNKPGVDVVLWEANDPASNKGKGLRGAELDATIDAMQKGAGDGQD